MQYGAGFLSCFLKNLRGACVLSIASPKKGGFGVTRPLFWAGSVLLLTAGTFCSLPTAAAIAVSAAGTLCFVLLSGGTRPKQAALLALCWVSAAVYCLVWPVWFTARIAPLLQEPQPAVVTVTKVETQGRLFLYTGRAAFLQDDATPSIEVELHSFVDLNVLPGEQTACVGSLSIGKTLQKMAKSPLIFRYESSIGMPEGTFHPMTAKMASWREQLAERAWRLAGEGATGGLTAAMLTGDLNRLPKANLRQLRSSGLAHLVVVSGLHLSTMALLLAFLLRRTRILLRAGVVLVFCWVFAALTGFGASVVRAAVMLSVTETGGVFSRRSDGPTSLALAGIALVLTDLRMAGSVSFWLSFLSTAGILFFFSPLTRIFRKDKDDKSVKARLLHGLSAGAAASASAQFGALPVLITTFGTVSPMGILANIPCVFLTTLMLPLGWLGLAASIWLPFAASLPGMLIKWCADAILFIAHIVSLLPFSVVGINERYSLIGIWILWASVFALVVQRVKRRYGWNFVRRFFACLLLPLALSHLFFGLASQNTAQAVFFPEPGAVAVLRGGNAVLLGAPSSVFEALRMADVLERLGVKNLDGIYVLRAEDANAPLAILAERLHCSTVIAPDDPAVVALCQSAGLDSYSLKDAPADLLGIPAVFSEDEVALHFQNVRVLKTKASCAIIKTNSAPLLSVGSDVVRYRLAIGDINNA
jgi:ComEC/Rec2-related protein